MCKLYSWCSKLRKHQSRIPKIHATNLLLVFTEFLFNACLSFDSSGEIFFSAILEKKSNEWNKKVFEHYEFVVESLVILLLCTLYKNIFLLWCVYTDQTETEADGTLYRTQWHWPLSWSGSLVSVGVNAQILLQLLCRYMYKMLFKK